MASGSFEFNASGYLQGKIDWSSSSNGSSANSSNVTAILYARRTNSYTTKGQSWSGYVKIGSTQKNISFSDSVSVSSGWVEMARVPATVAHSNDGSGSAVISGSVTGPSGTALSGNTSSGSKTVTLDKIARYTSISSFTVSKRSENTFTFAWKTADTVDYIWYSTDNGNKWIGYDTADGTSGSFIVGNLSPNTTYNCKLRVRRKDSQLTTDSGTVSQTTYKAPTFSMASKTETTITVNWSCDSTVDYIWYSTNSGSNWYGVDVSDGTSGSITISKRSDQISTNLSPNTSYGIRLRVRRKESQTTYDIGSGSLTTYDYPYCTEAPNFTIGNNVTIKLYNPLNRTVQIQMWSHVGRQFVSELITINGTSYTGFSDVASRLYASIPNNTASKYNIDVWYGDNKAIKEGGNYSIIGTEIPSFSDFTYKDTNATTVALTGSNQILVNGYSNVKATISTSNKAVANNSATMETYKMTIGNKTTNAVNYSSSSAVDLTISGINNGTITVYATDSRGLSTSVSKNATFKNYSDLVIKSATATRGSNGVGSAVTLAFNGTYWNSSFGSTTNSITQVKYFYKETSASSWITGTTTLSVTTSGANWSGSASIKGDLGADGFDISNAYNIRLQVTDCLVTKTYDLIIGSGTPGIAIYKNKVAIGKKYDTSQGGPLQINANGGGFVTTENNTAQTATGFRARRTDTDVTVELQVGTGGINHGLYSRKLNKWMIYGDDTSVHLNGNAESATSWGGLTNDVSTKNDIDTWIPVLNGMKLQHVVKRTASEKTHTNYNTNQGELATIQFLSFWNGAYDSSNNSNLTYAHQGIIQCKPKNLYNNASGTTGTVTLSETAANFNMLEIFYTDNAGNQMQSIRVASPNGETITLDCIEPNNYGQVYAYQRISSYSISGTSITRKNSVYIQHNPSAVPNINTNVYIVIKKVLGWR